MRKGNCRSRAASTGSSQASLMRAVAATICHCVTSSTALMWYTPLAPRLIALVHGVDPQIAGLALRIGPPPLANRHRRGLGLDVVQAAFAIARLLPQVVQVGHRDGGQPLVFRLAVLLIRALQNAPGGRSAQAFMRRIDGGQQLQRQPGYSVAGSGAAGKQRAGSLRGPDSGRSAASPGPGSGRSSFLGSAATSRAPGGLVSGTAVGAEPAPPSRKPAGDVRLRTGCLRWLLEKPRSHPGSASLLRARWLSILSMPSAPGSSCIGIRPPLQAHLVLEKTTS